VVASAAALPALREELDSLPSVKKVIVLDDLPLRKGEVFIGELREMGLKFLKDKAAKLEERIASAGEAGPALACKPSDVAVREGSVLLMALPQGRSSEQLAGLCTMMKNGGSVATVPAGEDLSDVIGAVRPHILLTAPDVIRDFKNGVEDSVRAKGPRTQRLFDWAVRHAKDRPHVVRLLDCKLFKPVREKVFGGRMEFIVGGGALPDEDILRWYSAIGLPVVQNRETI
jgi:long-chain acyl-CoA synthetase